MKNTDPSRRAFVLKTAMAAGTVFSLPAMAERSFFNSSVDDTIRIALIGCGGRGTGASDAGGSNTAIHQSVKARAVSKCLGRSQRQSGQNEDSGTGDFHGYSVRFVQNRKHILQITCL